MLSLVLFGTMLCLFVIGVPIAFAMGLAASSALLVLPRAGFEVIVQRMFFGLDSFVVLSVPLFLLLGELMERAQITDRLVAFANALVGRLRGGLGHVSIVTNMVMAGISGSGSADAAATGAILVPAMRRAGYPVPFSAALIGAAATIGPIIPPSIVLVIYASITGVSVGRLFLGGIVPGLVMGLSLMVLNAWLARRRDFPRGPQVGIAGLVTATRRALLVIVTPLIVVAGIVGGVFTPTESAAIACFYALVLGVVVYRTIPLSALPEVFLRTAWTTGKVMLVFAAASIFSWILARGNVPAELARLPMLSDAENPAMMLLALNLLLLALGALMDAIAIIVIITPMFLPLALAAGLDPVHLGVVMAVNISIGLVTPPVGSILFVLCGLTGTTVPQLTREIWIFVLALLLPLLLITYNPALVLFLPNLLMGPV